MKIDRLELRLLKLPLVHFFETSFSRVYDKHFILVTLDAGNVRGYGECVADVDPFYSAETNDTASIFSSPVFDRALISRARSCGEMGSSPWRPSRGPTSRITTSAGSPREVTCPSTVDSASR